MAPTLTVADVVGLLEQRYPPGTAEGWDAVGLVAGDPAAPVRKVVFAVDPVQAVADEAIAAGADLLVTHHPLYLRGTTTVSAATPTSPWGRRHTTAPWDTRTAAERARRSARSPASSARD